MIASISKLLLKHALTVLLIAGLVTHASAQKFSYNASGQLTAVAAPGGSSPITIATPPAATKKFIPGEAFSLSVFATGGAGPLSYQWKKGTANVNGATSPNLVFANPSSADAGTYTVVISDGVGTPVTSSASVVSVLTDPLADVIGGNPIVTQSGSINWRVLTGNDQIAPGGAYSIGIAAAHSDQSSLTLSFNVTSMSELSFRLLSSYGIRIFVTSPLSTRQLPPSQNQWAPVFIHFPSPGTYTVKFEVDTGGGAYLLSDLKFQASPDTDNDGMSDTWEEVMFGSGGAQLPDDDYDQDHVSNLREFLDETNANWWLSYFRRIETRTIGSGTISRDVAELLLGYPYPGPQVTLNAVPSPGNVFMGWSHSREFVPFYYQPYQGNTDGGAFRLTANFAPEVTLAAAADNSTLTWTSGGSNPWKGQTASSNDGQDSLMSGVCLADGTPGDGWLQATITGPRTIEYDFRGEGSAYQQMNGTINGDLDLVAGQSSSWSHRKVFLPAGNHTLRWYVSPGYSNIPKTWNRFFIDRVTTTTPVDSDNDGMADDWEEHYFGSLENTGPIDSDTDGVSDLLEYQHGTSPSNSASRRHTMTLATSGSGTATITPARSYYLRGQSVQLQANAAPGWRLERWEGAPEITSQSLSFYVDRDIAITAVFVPENTLNEALDQNLLTFGTGIPGWSKVTTGTHDGTDAAKSPAGGDYQNSTITAAVTGPKIVAFWWKAEASSNATSSLSFTDGNQTINLQGTVGWERRFVTIPAGGHTLTWAFNKGNDPAAAAWLDQVMIGDDANGDGLPDDWKTANFGATAAAAGDDGDSDNNSNLVEWADGTNPKLSSSAIYRLSMIKPVGAAVTISPDLSGYAPGASVTITAPAAFTHWSGSATGSANPLTVTMNTSKTITANFNPVAEGLDNMTRSWTNGGVGQWRVVSPGPYDAVGGDVAASHANLTPGQESWTQATFTGPGVVTFRAYASFDTSTGSLKWQLDGDIRGNAYSYYGSNHEIRIPDGVHILRFSYVQGTGSAYDNAGFVDDLRFTPDAVIPMADALDNTNLTWSVTPVGQWIGTDTESADGIDAARTVLMGHNGQAHLQTTVTITQNTELSFWWKASSDYNDYFRLRLNNNAVIPAISGFGDWAKIRIILTPGTHVLKWSYEKDATVSQFDDMAYLDDVRLTVLPSIPLATALDGTGLTWTTGGTTPWYGLNTTSHDAVDAAGSGMIFDGQQSWVQTTVTGPGVVNFWWKVSCEQFDGFFFLVDGAAPSAVPRITGDTGWQEVTYSIPSGSHTLRWSYSKDSFEGERADQAWLDQVTFSAPGTFGYWAFGAGLSSDQRGQLISAAGDGIPNLHKYAFNLAPANSIQGNARYLTAGTGVSGLPLITKTGSGATQKLRMEFIRRKTSDLIYLPRFSNNLTMWDVLPATTTVTSIDSTWERVVVESPVSTAKIFGRVSVTGP